MKYWFSVARVPQDGGGGWQLRREEMYAPIWPRRDTLPDVWVEPLRRFRWGWRARMAAWWLNRMHDTSQPIIWG